MVDDITCATATRVNTPHPFPPVETYVAFRPGGADETDPHFEGPLPGPTDPTFEGPLPGPSLGAQFVREPLVMHRIDEFVAALTRR